MSGRILPALRPASFDPDEDRRRPNSAEVIRRCAFAIYANWSRETNPARARTRFENLPPCTLQAFEKDAAACLEEAAAAGWRP